MNRTLQLWTDIAMLVMFDPTLFEGQPQDWPYPLYSDPRVKSGEFVAVELPGDCTFRLRVTCEGLNEREASLLNDSVGPLSLVVRSGRVYASGMDMPCEPVSTYMQHGAGDFFELPVGAYDVMVHEFDLSSVHQSDLTNLPDFVAVIRSRESEFPGVRNDPRFSGGKWLERQLKDLRGEK